MTKLTDLIRESLKQEPHDVGRLKDLYLVAEHEHDIPSLRDASAHCERIIPELIALGNVPDAQKVMGLHKRILLAAAQDDFDSFVQYMEWNREPEKRFYLPRRKQLKLLVDSLQDLADDKLDLLALSLPPGVGKSTLAIFYLVWNAGKYSDEPMLTGSHSNSFVRGVYGECLRMMDRNGDYLWHDVFPEVEVSSTNANDCRIDLGKRKRFETLEFTSIGTGNAGLYRASRLLYCDDLVSGIEVALSRERLDKLWETYTTDLRQRMIGDHCKELHIATRWSVHDVIGRLEDEHEGDERARFIAIPAMDENDESNFDYLYGIGFKTQFYRKQRDIMDPMSWEALYMNQPIEREGQLYKADELRRFFELPEREPDAIIAVCDTKDKGKDYAVIPVAYQYGQDFFIADVLCDNSNPDIVDVRMTDILYRNKVQMCQFESNSAGGRVAQKIQEELKKRGGRTKITTKYTTENKETKIIVNSPYVKEHFLFWDDSKYKKNSDYGKFMGMLTGYTTKGKNAHDDCPDAMAMLALYVQTGMGAKIELTRRLF